jgi:hypothetical protein
MVANQKTSEAKIRLGTASVPIAIEAEGLRRSRRLIAVDAHATIDTIIATQAMRKGTVMKVIVGGLRQEVQAERSPPLSMRCSNLAEKRSVRYRVTTNIPCGMDARSISRSGSAESSIRSRTTVVRYSAICAAGGAYLSISSKRGAYPSYSSAAPSIRRKPTGSHAQRSAIWISRKVVRSLITPSYDVRQTSGSGR